MAPDGGNGGGGLAGDEKRQLLQEALRTQGKLIDSELQLELQAQGAGIDPAQKQAIEDQLAQVREQIDRLSATINALRARIAEQWTGEAEDLIPKLKEANGRIQDRIREIDQTAATAQKVGQILELAVSVVGLVESVLP
jgi:chromosome segregation ATPase